MRGKGDRRREGAGHRRSKGATKGAKGGAKGEPRGGRPKGAAKGEQRGRRRRDQEREGGRAPRRGEGDGETPQDELYIVATSEGADRVPPPADQPAAPPARGPSREADRSRSPRAGAAAGHSPGQRRMPALVVRPPSPGGTRRVHFAPRASASPVRPAANARAREDSPHPRGARRGVELTPRVDTDGSGEDCRNQ